ncbi:hypothetical protein, partial [Paraburkholderia sp. BR14320]|uniref:hypothetical protein n=1 Tax=unclassified Paraburkholderia TaxID=2615204 RepID=UPI0034CD6FB9
SSAPSATFHLPRQKPLTMQISLSLSLWHDASKTVSGKPGAAQYARLADLSWLATSSQRSIA